MAGSGLTLSSPPRADLAPSPALRPAWPPFGAICQLPADGAPGPAASGRSSANSGNAFAMLPLRRRVGASCGWIWGALSSRRRPSLGARSVASRAGGNPGGSPRQIAPRRGSFPRPKKTTQPPQCAKTVAKQLKVSGNTGNATPPTRRNGATHRPGRDGVRAALKITFLDQSGLGASHLAATH